MTPRASFRPTPAMLLAIVLGALVCWLAIGVTSAAFRQNLHFDGAMNLEVSRSLAAGEGPRRLYDRRVAFPAEIQTKEPFVLVGAAVFSVLGVSPATAQLPNLLFLFALCALAFVAGKRVANTATGLFAVALVLATPTTLVNGLNGLGEVPSLVFGLASLLCVALPRNAPGARGCLVAGVLAGLAVATKVVAAIVVGGVLLVLVVRLLRAPGRIQRATAFAAGAMLPLLAIEAWRLLVLGGDGYIAWWRFQAEAISYHAGMGSSQHFGPAVAGDAGIASKVAHHFHLLAAGLGLSVWHLGGMLAGGFAAAISCFVVPGARRARWVVAGLLAVSAVYLAWWLALNPTASAYIRRIYDGLVCLELAAVLGLGASCAALSRGTPAARAWLAGAGAACLLPFAPLAWSAMQRPVDFAPDPDTRATLRAATVVRGLPADAAVLGYGWYSAPAVALFSGRQLLDYTDWPVARLAEAPAYLVTDRFTRTVGIASALLRRYPSVPLSAPNEYAQVFRVDFENPYDPFATATAEPAKGIGNEPYSLSVGYEPFDAGLGGRWVESDSEILLRYDGEARLELAAYVAPASYYRLALPLNGLVSVDGCAPMPIRFDATGWRRFDLPMGCKPADGPVRVRILTDNVMEMPTTHDRQRALLVGRIGFVD